MKKIVVLIMLMITLLTGCSKEDLFTRNWSCYDQSIGSKSLEINFIDKNVAKVNDLITGDGITEYNYKLVNKRELSLGKSFKDNGFKLLGGLFLYDKSESYALLLTILWSEDTNSYLVSYPSDFHHEAVLYFTDNMYDINNLGDAPFPGTKEYEKMWNKRSKYNKTFSYNLADVVFDEINE